MDLSPAEREALAMLRDLPTGSRLAVIQAITGASPTRLKGRVRYSFYVEIGEAAPSARPSRRRRAAPVRDHGLKELAEDPSERRVA